MQSATRFSSLDGLRGLAAVAVVLFHTDHAIMPGGHLAVDFFFCLSGFVIALNYAGRLKAGELGFWRFTGLRMARLYPMMLVGGLLAMWLVSAGPRILLLVPETWNRALYPGNPPFWSLVAELAVNLLFALVLVRLNWRWLAVVCAAAAAGLVWFSATDPRTVELGLAEQGAFWSTLPGGAFRAIFSFSFGILLHAIWHRGTKAPKAHIAALIVPLLLLGVLLLAPEERRWWDIVCALVVLPALTFAAIRFEMPFPRISRWLGDLSYPLYCIHVPLLFATGKADGPKLLVALALIPAAWLLDRVYDRPARKWLTRLVNR